MFIFYTNRNLISSSSLGFAGKQTEVCSTLNASLVFFYLTAKRLFDYITALIDIETASIDNDTASIDNDTAPNNIATAPIDNDTAPNDNTTAPFDNDTAPVDIDTASIDNATALIDNDTALFFRLLKISCTKAAFGCETDVKTPALAQIQPIKENTRSLIAQTAGTSLQL